MKLSIIVPIFNEENNLEGLFREIDKNFSNINYEVLFINDGSVDNSKKVLDKLFRENEKNIKVVNFSRNFGKEAAIYAGIKYSSGMYTAIIDADMQQDPKYILNGLNYLEKNEEKDVVAFIPDKKKISSRIEKK